MDDGAVILSFDVEEHHRIEAATAVGVSSAQKHVYADRMEHTTRRLLELLDTAGAPATFFIVGEIAVSHPKLVADIAAAGHEIGSHGWDHRRVHCFTPLTFRDDIGRSKDVLEQTSGTPVVGYRAPTFSVVPETRWAIDVLAEAGLKYDSSIFPVRHDRYGVPVAPRTPFIAEGINDDILELPLTTFRLFGQNLPVAGGGYFRLFPLAAMTSGVAQLHRENPAVSMLYFHPWEFDSGQPRLPLNRLSSWRTYVGVGRTFNRLEQLLSRYRGRFRRGVDVATELSQIRGSLTRYRLSES